MFSSSFNSSDSDDLNNSNRHMGGGDLKKQTIVDLASNIRNNLIKFRNNENNTDKEVEQSSCIACLLPFSKGSYIITMPCCGQLIHIECIGKIANTHQLMMRHECPKCFTPFTPEQVIYFKKIWISAKNAAKD